METIKLVIFDLDGTLLYTIKDISVALNYALKKHNLDLVSIDDTLSMVGNGVNELIIKAIKGNNDLFDLVKNDYRSYYLNHNNVYTYAYQGIMHLVKMLKRAKIKLAVLSNKSHDNTLSVINYYFPNMFDYVLGRCDNLNLKPSIDGVNVILNKLNVNKENVLYLGDSEVDVKTAQNANLVMGACLWGYRNKNALNGANLFFNSPKEIENYVLKTNDLIVNGVFLYDKPAGVTSQEAIINVKHKLTNLGYMIEKIGHAGTLDPLATGLLVVLLNDATKISPYLLNEDKAYIAKCLLGVKTDTLDIDGKVIDTKDTKVNEEEIDKVLDSFIGKQKQVPPMYSSIKIDGKKLYELARQNKEIDLDARDIEIYELNRTTKLINNEFSFYAHVSKGTYIRSLCNDLGLKLNTYGTIKELRRTKSGKFDIKDAYTDDDLDSGNIRIIKMNDAIGIKKIDINNDIYLKVMDGKPLKKDSLNDIMDNEVALIHESKLVAIYYYDFNTDRYKARRVWK